MADSTPKSYSTDPALYLYTSLTSGSSHIVTATSRMETILKANKVPFKALDIATDEKARMLWGRRAGKDESGRPRKIPGLVQMGLVIGDIVEVEDWNEYGELKLHIKIHHEGGAPVKPAVPTPSSTPSKAPVAQVDTKAAAPESSKPVEVPTKSPSPATTQQASITLALRQAGEEAAQKAKDGKKKTAQVVGGGGNTQPAKDASKSTVVAPPADLESSTETHIIDTQTLLQSPRSSMWKNDAHAAPATPRHSIDKVESLQSPTSTAWKSVLEHRTSLAAKPSTAKVQRFDEDDTSSEEDEDEEDDDDDEDDDEEEEDDDEEGDGEN